MLDNILVSYLLNFTISCHELNASFVLIESVGFEAVIDGRWETLVHLFCLIDLVVQRFFLFEWDVFTRAILKDWFDPWRGSNRIIVVYKCWWTRINQRLFLFQCLFSFDFAVGMSQRLFESIIWHLLEFIGEVGWIFLGKGLLLFFRTWHQSKSIHW